MSGGNVLSVSTLKREIAVRSVRSFGRQALPSERTPFEQKPPNPLKGER